MSIKLYKQSKIIINSVSVKFFFSKKLFKIVNNFKKCGLLKIKPKILFDVLDKIKFILSILLILNLISLF